MLALLIAVAIPPLDTCEAAVRQLGTIPSASIAEACHSPPDPDRLWKGADSKACSDAMARGERGARMGDLPPDIRAGIIRSFEDLAAKCRAPAPPRPANDRTQSDRLWN